MTRNRRQTGWQLALLAAVLMLAGIVAGCASGSGASDPSTDKKAMLESVAKWYTAQGSLDMVAFKAGIYDPQDILGVATMTAAPPGASKAEVKWNWSGETILVTVPSEQSTITLSVDAAKPTTVQLKDATGQGGVFIMKKVDNVWKIDVAETQKASAAQSQPDSSTVPPQ